VAIFYLLQENGSKITLENGSGSIILEASSGSGPTVDWQAGGAGHPVKRKRKNATEELFDSIERSLEVALGLVEVPLDLPAEAILEEAAPTWSEERYRTAILRLGRISGYNSESSQRFARLEAMLRAYEEAQARERALQDDEETWFLMS